jgi:hypothetical protein
MSTPQDDAFLSEVSREHIAALATLYDRFANALDPFDSGWDEAERVFNEEVTEIYDCLQQPKPALRDFKKAVILRCKIHLAKTDKPPSV